MTIRQSVVTAFIMGTLVSCGGGNSTSAVETEIPVDQPTEAVAITSGKYKIKSGIIHFDVDAMGMKSKKVVYFDDFGAKERVEQYNEDGTVREVAISDGKTRYNLFPADKKAYFADEYGSRGWEMEFTSWDQIKNLRNYEEKYKQGPGMNIAGKDCESFVYGESTTFAGWKGLTLYHQQGSNISVKANSLEEDAAIPAEQFTVPEGYEVVKPQ